MRLWRILVSLRASKIVRKIPLLPFPLRVKVRIFVVGTSEGNSILSIWVENWDRNFFHIVIFRVMKSRIEKIMFYSLKGRGSSLRGRGKDLGDSILHGPIKRGRRKIIQVQIELNSNAIERSKV